MKIAISGHSGIGKTTLAKQISEHYGIPFITTSSKVIWEKHGIKSQADIMRKSAKHPEWGIHFQLDLLTYRKSELDKYDKYVTDRSILDNWVYFIINNSAFISKYEIKAYLHLCQRFASEATEDSIHIHLASSWEMIKDLENDGFRISNPYFQNMVNQVFEACIHRKDILLPNFTHIETWDYKHRWHRVSDSIEHAYRAMNIDSREKFNVNIKK